MNKKYKVLIMLSLLLTAWGLIYFYGRSAVQQLKTEVRIAIPVFFSQSTLGEKYKGLIQKSLEAQSIRVTFVGVDVFNNGTNPEFSNNYDLLFVPKSYLKFQKDLIYTSLPLITYNQYIISFKNNKKFNPAKLNDFQGAIGKNLGGYYAFLEILPKNLIVYENVKESFFAVKDKKADYFIAEDPFVLELKSRNVGSDTISVKMLYKNEYYLAGSSFQKDNIEIIEKSLLDYLSKNKADKDYQEILNYLPIIK